MQRHLWTVQHPQQLVLVGVQPFQQAVERGEPGAAAEDPIEAGAQRRLHIFIYFGQLCSWKPDTDVHRNRTAVFMISATRFQPGQYP